MKELFFQLFNKIDNLAKLFEKSNELLINQNKTLESIHNILEEMKQKSNQSETIKQRIRVY